MEQIKKREEKTVHYFNVNKELRGKRVKVRIAHGEYANPKIDYIESAPKDIMQFMRVYKFSHVTFHCMEKDEYNKELYFVESFKAMEEVDYYKYNKQRIVNQQNKLKNKYGTHQQTAK